MRILFQGDSITDVCRYREDDNYSGMGYPRLVEARLGYENPDYEFFNRGISGDRTVDVLARVKIDIINLKPDVMSILLGINDVWHQVSFENGVDDKYSEIYYDLLIQEIKEALPQTKIMILEPYVTHGTAVDDNWNTFYEGALNKGKIARKIAEKHSLTFVPLMDEFKEAEKKAPANRWTIDGVHPTAMGHQIIANEWIRAFESLK